MLRSGVGLMPLRRPYHVSTQNVNVINVYKQTPRLIPKGSSALLKAESVLYEKYDKDGSKRRLLSRNNPGAPKAGDILRVTHKDRSSFTGMLLALNRSGVGSTILLRTKIAGLGVENRYPIFNPDISKIEVLRVPTMRWPKEKYYFVRGLRKYDAGDMDSAMRKQRL